MSGSSWRIPPATNGSNPPPPQHQYQQIHPQYAAPPQHSPQLLQHQMQQQQPMAPYPPRGNPPVDSWRAAAAAARDNTTVAAPNSASASSGYERNRERSRSPRSPRDRSSRRRSPDDRRRRSRSRDRYRKRSPNERERGAAAPPSTGPTKLVFLTQLPYESQHDPLTILFARQGFIPSDVKIFDKQDRGSIRSMGFVEFVDVASAKKWMEQNQNVLTISDGRKVAAEYVNTSREECCQRRDWICAKCTLANYMSRDTCFRCNVSKSESDTLEARGFADIGDRQPCDTLLFRDMPEGVNECRVLDTLRRVTQDQLRFKQVKLSESREFAWVQMLNASDAQMLMNCFQKSPLQISGSIVITTFSRRPLSVILADPTVSERAKPPPAAEEPQLQQQHGMQQQPQFGQFTSPPPGMPPGMNPMMPPPHVMMSGPPPSSPFGMPPPGMGGGAGMSGGAMQQQQQQLPPHFNMPPPGMMMPPPGMAPQSMGMMGGPPPTMMMHPQQQPQPSAHAAAASQQQQQLLQTQLAAAAQMGLMPNMSLPPPGNFNVPPPQMQQQPMQPAAAAAAADPTAQLQAQLSAMAAQQAALQAQLQQIASGGAAAAAAAPPPAAEPEKLGHILTPVGLLQQFEPPNPQTFMPEPTSGYMHDPKTNLYYDPKTTYFYNSVSSKWTYYDAHFKTYIAVDEREKVQQALLAGFGQNGGSAAAAPSTEEKKEKTPSEIAKEMMKWAKKADKAASKVQMSLKPTVKPLETKSAFGSAAAAAAAAQQQPVAAAASGSSSSVQTGFGTEVTLKMLDRAKNPLAHLNSDSEDEDSQQPSNNYQQPSSQSRHHQMQQQPPDRELQEQLQQLQQRHPNMLPMVGGGGAAAAAEPAREEPKVRSAAEHREAMVAQLIDRAGKQCLLCRRAFPTVEVLDKHIAKSDLHKKNLDEKQVEWGKAYVASIMAATDGKGGGGGGDYGASVASTSAPSSSSGGSWGSAPAASAADSYKYRDRAKERRNIHGIDAISADPFAAARDTGGSTQAQMAQQQRESDAIAARPLDSGNIGNKLLQKMGWQEGGGVGKNLQGIAAPITAERRVEGTGLGLAGSKITHGVHASHQEKTRAALFSRFQGQ